MRKKKCKHINLKPISSGYVDGQKCKDCGKTFWPDSNLKGYGGHYGYD